MTRSSLIAAVLCAGTLSVGCGEPSTAACVGFCMSPSLHTLDLLAGVAGGSGWVDGPFAEAHLAQPNTLTGDGAGHLYLLDGETVRLVDLAAETVTTLAGVYGNAGGLDGTGPAALFFDPKGIAVGTGAAYVTNTEDHTLRKVELATGVTTTIAGAPMILGTDDGVGIAARFREPEALAIDSRDGDSLYICDTDNQLLRKLVLSTGVVSTVAGTAATAGMADGVGTAAQFYEPRGAAMDAAGNLYVLDTGTKRIRRVTVDDATVSTLATLDAKPTGIAVVGAELVVSLLDHRVVRVDATTGVVTALAGSAGQSGFLDGTGDAARFDDPAGLWSDGVTIYVADTSNYAIRALALDGTVTTLVGTDPFGSTDGAPAAARFAAPQSVVADANGTLYVADTNNDTLRTVSLATGTVTTLAGAAGQPGSTDGNGTSARFNQPAALALGVGRLFVADTANRALRAVDLATGDVTTLVFRDANDAPLSLLVPAALAYDERGRLYLSDAGNHVVLALDLDAMTGAVLAGASHQAGASDGQGNAARFDAPGGLAFDGRGTLYVADILNDAVRAITVENGETTTLAGTLGMRGDTDATGGAARFSYPTQLALGGLGDLFVADSLNNAIRHIDVGDGVVTTVAGGGPPGVHLGPLPAQVTGPAALAFTADGHLVMISESAILVAR